MAQSPLEQQQLAQGLMSDLSRAQSTVASGEAGTGVSSAPESGPQAFGAKAIRVKGQIIAQKELADAKMAFNKAIQYRLENQDFANAAERQKFKMEMEKKFHNFQLQIIQSGAQMDATRKQSVVDQTDKETMTNLFMQAISGATTAAMMSGSGGNPSDKAISGGSAVMRGSVDKSHPEGVSVFDNGYGSGTPNYSGMNVAEGYGNQPTPSPSPASPYDNFNRLQSNPYVSPDQDKTNAFVKGFRG